ncbi:MAG: hypothetical protein AB1798_03055 [Spirochaetota bacterium]
MRIAVLANLIKNAPRWEGMPPEQWDDLDSPKTIDNIISSLEKEGHTAEFFEARIQAPFRLVDKLQSYKPDLCFNIAEGHFGCSRESHIPSILEMLRLPYTGSRVLSLAIALDKPLTKRLLHYHGLPTPEFQVFGAADEPINDDFLDRDVLKFPLFIKPSREGTGMGVSAKNIIRGIAELREKLKEMLHRFKQPVLCERFIQGRELTVGFVGNLKLNPPRRMSDKTAPLGLPQELTFFPPLELDTDAYDPEEAGIYTGRIKTELVHDFHYMCPASLAPEAVDLLNKYSAATFRVLGCLDVARVDFRFDTEDNNKPYILEINPLPGLNAEYSDLPLQAKAYGWSYERLINTIVELAAERQNIVEKHHKSGYKAEGNPE